LGIDKKTKSFNSPISFGSLLIIPSKCNALRFLNLPIDGGNSTAKSSSLFLLP
jgi:hypothetical protein